MLDKSVPYRQIIMRADTYHDGPPARLPEGYTFEKFKIEDERHWAEIVTSVGKFDSVQQALDFFEDAYEPHLHLIAQRCTFVVSPDGEYVGTCTAWLDTKGDTFVGALHCLAVCPEHQGKGIGKALMQETMGKFRETTPLPIYLQTQTWSWRTIALYRRFGFRIVERDTFGEYVNEYDEAMKVLCGVMGTEDWDAG